MIRKTKYKTANMNPVNLKKKQLKLSGHLVLVSKYALEQSHNRLLKAFGGVFVPIPCLEQVHVSFTIPVAMAIKYYINAQKLKFSNCIIESLSFNNNFCIE